MPSSARYHHFFLPNHIKKAHTHSAESWPNSNSPNVPTHSLDIAMPLTSVQVRGKRKQPQQPSSSSDPSARPTKAKRSLNQVHAARAFNPRARLEALPTEILEDVLLYSVNVALPRCSHVVGAKLSDRATLIRFCMVVFDDTWSKHLGKQPGRYKPRDDRRHAKVEVSISNQLPTASSRLTNHSLRTDCPPRTAVGQGRHPPPSPAGLGSALPANPTISISAALGYISDKDSHVRPHDLL